MSLRLRRAVAADARPLFELANEAEVRRVSITTDPISWDEHVAWLEARLASADSALLVVEVAGDFKGQVRFDRRDRSDADISVAITPGARGEGLGRQLIVEASRSVSTWLPGIEVVHAWIRPDNRASQRAFEAAGYRQAEPGERRGVVLDHWVFEVPDDG